MAAMIDPLVKLAALGAYPHLEERVDGSKRISLTFARSSTHKAQQQAQALLKRYERLLLMQLDVKIGCIPRTVQQLVASGRIKIKDGKFLKA